MNNLEEENKALKNAIISIKSFARERREFYQEKFYYEENTEKSSRIIGARNAFSDVFRYIDRLLPNLKEEGDK